MKESADDSRAISKEENFVDTANTTNDETENVAQVASEEDHEPVKRRTRSSSETKSKPRSKSSGAKRKKKRKQVEEEEEEEKPQTLAGRIFSIASTVLSVLMITVCLVIFVSAIANPGENGVPIGPFRCLVVTSGSMEPAIHVGSMIVVQRVAEEEIKVEDVVTRLSANDRDFVTHRVVEIDENHNFITRGDANREDEFDEPFPYSEIVGKVVLTIPMIGILINFSSTPMGMGLVILVFILFMVFVEIIKKLLRA